jgi:hypothetical protein
MVVVVGMLALALVLLVEVVVDYYFEVGKDSFCKTKEAGTV